MGLYTPLCSLTAFHLILAEKFWHDPSTPLHDAQNIKCTLLPEFSRHFHLIYMNFKLCQTIAPLSTLYAQCDDNWVEKFFAAMLLFTNMTNKKKNIEQAMQEHALGWVGISARGSEGKPRIGCDRSYTSLKMHRLKYWIRYIHWQHKPMTG